MLLCLASAGMTIARPTYACGLCSTMLLFLASAGIAILVPPMQLGCVL